MFKMKKKIFLGLFLILILVANMSFASYSTVQMSVVEEPVATIEFGSNSKFEKKLISKDLTNKEVTLQLQVNNGEASKKPTGEIVLVLDNSDSMNNEITTTNGKTTRKQLIFDSAKTVITNLLKDNKDLKISVVSFSTNTTASKEGTTEDATLVSGLSNSSSVLTNAIDSIEANGPRTDLEAGLDLASKQFSSTATNKYMIVLTDGVPNVSLGHNNPYYSDDTINATKAKLQAIEKQNIKLFTMLSGISDESYVPSGTTKTFGEIINEVFGTTKTPTAGTFYYVSDDKIEETVTTIYNSLMPISQSYKNIQIVDYFPKEIIDNFDFAYVEKANIGEISAKVDTTNNSITWTIPELASGQTATVQYKLKLKQNFDSNIVGKILNTNEKVDLSYNDFDNNKQEKTTDVTPKLKLAEPPAQLPKAGLNSILAGIIIITVLAIFFFVRFKKLNNDIK
jgi:von willebrand factor type A domain